MATFLIAGASGYVGSRLAGRLLERGERVRGLVRDPDDPAVEALAARGMSVWIGDLTRPATLEGVAAGVDYVLNLTSRSVLENGSQRATFVDGNQNLIAACSRSRQVRAYLFTSNTAPYGDAGDEPVGEDAPIAPSYPLGDLMVAAEQTIMQAVRDHRFPAMILRVAAIYGPERDIVAAVEAGMATIFGSGRNFIPHIHVDDLVELLIAAVERGEPGAIYNIGDDEPARLIDLIGEIRQRLGMLPPRTYSPAVALSSGMDPNIIGMLTASVRLDNRRMRHDLGVALRYPSVYSWLDVRLPVEEALAVGA